MFERVFNKMAGYYVNKICRVAQQKINEKDVPRYAGVYVIYSKNKPLYVGRSINLYRRFVHQHLSKRNDVAASSFRMHLLMSKRVAAYKESRQWILKNCTVKFVKTDNYDVAVLLEAFLIRLWRKKFHLLNDNKDDGR